jgi:23S rRNA pseudouridine2605 synthase
MPGKNRPNKPENKRKRPGKKVPGVRPYRTDFNGEEKLENRRPRISRDPDDAEPRIRRKSRPIRSSAFDPEKKQQDGRIRTHKERSNPSHGPVKYDAMRLNQYIASSGVCSRREADTYIKSGKITVNGKTVTELGVKVTTQDVVKLEGRKLKPESRVYILLNKPKNVMTTTEDPHAEKTVMDLVRNACRERIYPVGRLDRNTTGLLLLTNDGTLAKRLSHPSHRNKKIYQVSLDKPVIKDHLRKISEGIDLEDGIMAADTISYIDPDHKEEVGIEIHSGKNRVVRRMFEHLGYKVKKLDRVYYAGLTKKNLPRGKWRFLTNKEVNFLKMQ